MEPDYPAVGSSSRPRVLVLGAGGEIEARANSLDSVWEVLFFGYRRNRVMMPIVPVATYRPSGVQATLATIVPPGSNHWRILVAEARSHRNTQFLESTERRVCPSVGNNTSRTGSPCPWSRACSRGIFSVILQTFTVWS